MGRYGRIVAIAGLLAGCDGGSDEPDGASTQTDSSGSDPGSGTSDGSSTGETSPAGGESTTTTGADACEPPALSCTEPDGAACGGGAGSRSHGWSIDGQPGATSLDCVASPSDPLVFECDLATVTLELLVPDAPELPWSAGETVRVSWSNMSSVNESDTTFTVASPSGDTLLSAVSMHFETPDWLDAHPFAVEPDTGVCCGNALDVGLSFSSDEDTLTLFTDGRGTLAVGDAEYSIYVGEAWRDPCPPSGVTDLSSSTYDYVVVRAG